MMVDYLTLLLVNMAAGLMMLTLYVWKGIEDNDPRGWAVGFTLVGAVALAFGTHMALKWPVGKPYSMAFGEMSVLLGAIFVAGGYCVSRGISTRVLSYYAVCAGLAAIVIGVRMGQLGLTQRPIVTAVGFVFSGLAATLTGLAITSHRANRGFRRQVALLLGVSSAIWAVTGYMAYWGHMGG